jgi:hypothetical protein
VISRATQLAYRWFASRLQGLLRRIKRPTLERGSGRLSQEQIDVIKKLRSGQCELPASNRPFRNSKASGLDLSSFAWDQEDFSGRDLRGANLSGCTFSGADFRNADLWNADLADSDLTGARNLFSEQLAATNLRGAKLPESLQKFEALESTERLSDNSSKVFLTILVAVAYTFLTMATTKDIQLITNTNSSKLPVIGTEIPIVGFYVATPLILLALFVYFHIYLQRLWEAIAKLPAIFPSGRRLDEETHPWLMNDLARQHFPRLCSPALPLSRLQVFVSNLGGYWLVPATVVALWMQFLRVESWRITTLHLVMIAFVVGSAAYYTRLRHKTLGEKALQLSLSARVHGLIGIFRGIPAGLLALLAAYYCAFLVLEWDKRMDPVWMASLDPDYIPSRPVLLGDGILQVFSELGIARAPFVDDADISTKPPSWTGLDANRDAELALSKGVAFEGTKLRKIHARHTFFAKAALNNVDLNLPTS